MAGSWNDLGRSSWIGPARLRRALRKIAARVVGDCDGDDFGPRTWRRIVDSEFQAVDAGRVAF